MVKAGALRKRYVSFTVKGERFSEDEFKRGFYAEALKFFGEYGLSFVSLKLMSYNPATGAGMLRCARDKIDEVRGFLALVNAVNGKKARVVSEKTSGTIKSLESETD
jgi:ribonuclease P/MRP protein subunit POP5